MGSLAGHIVPGAFFTIYGILSCLNCQWYHLKTKSCQKAYSDSRTRKEKLTPSASTSFFEFKRDHDLSRKSWIPFTFSRLPVEPFAKIILPAMGLVVESFFDYRNGHVVMSVYSVWNSEGGMNDIGKLHHITMYGSFLLSGVVDLLTLCIRLPRQTSMLFFTIAFTVEALLFYLHTLGRNTLNVEVHTLLTYVIFTCIIFSMLRIFSAANFVINVGLGSSILLQGTWFIQAGYILFSGFLNHVEEDDRRYSMFIAVCFTWHLVFVALFNLVVWIALSICLRSRLLHKRSFRRRGFLASLRQGWQGTISEERNKLIVEEENAEAGNEIEMKHMAETCT